MTTKDQPVGRFAVLARAVRSGQPSTSSWPSALRRGLLVAVIVAVGAAVGEFATAATIAIGALNLGLVDAAVPRRELSRALVVVSAITALIAFLAAGVAGTWWAAPMLMVLAYITGAIGSAGLLAFNSTFMALVTGVIFTNDPGNWRNAAWLGVLVLIGSAMQSISGLIAWRYEREASLRRSMVNLVTELRQLVETDKEISHHHFLAASAQMKAEQMIDAAGLSPNRDHLYRSLLQQLSWTRVCVANWIGADHPTQEQRNYVIATLMAVDSKIRKRPVQFGATADVLQPPNPGPDGVWNSVVEQLGKLCVTAQRFHERLSVRSAGDLEALGNKPTQTSVESCRKASARDRRANIMTLLRPGSPGFRHATRLAVAVGFAEAITLIFSIDRGYWIVLTVVMVVKPDFSTTLVRGVLRIIGTAAAVLVAGSVLSVTGNPQWLMVMLVVVFAPLTMRWMSANYAFTSFAMGSTVLVLIEAGEPSGSPITLRLVNTLLGAAIAIAAYALWPRWTGDGLRSMLSTTLRTQQQWTDLVLRGLAGGPYSSADTRAAGNAARDAMLTARPAVDAAIIEPHRAECDTAAASGILDGVERAAMATLSIEVHLHQMQRDSAEQGDLVHVDMATRVAEHFDADLTAAQREIARDRDSTDESPSQSAVLVATNRTEAGPSETPCPEPATSQAIERLLAAADATALAARSA
ncbi:MAG TPA: hypothetical protein DCQ04_09130 [Actinobacteria bacterium]|nr:hypothetical protein [Actinomycetota bacterium]